MHFISIRTRTGLALRARGWGVLALVVLALAQPTAFRLFHELARTF